MDKSSKQYAKGVVYVASGERFVKEAAESVASLKAVMSDIPAILFTDFPEKAKGKFDEVRPMSEVHFNFLDKIYAMKHSPFERTLYVDTDVYFCREFRHLFTALDRFDIAAVPEPSRNHQYMERVPDYFPELNCGIILLRMDWQVKLFLDQWRDAFAKQLEETKYANDQLSFRELIFQSSLRFLTLGPEYNFRAEYAISLASWAKLYMIHARHVDFPEVKRIAEQSYKPRIFVPRMKYLEPRYFATFSPTIQWALYTMLRLLMPAIYVLGHLASRFGGKKRWQWKVEGNRLPWPPIR